MNPNAYLQVSVLPETSRPFDSVIATQREQDLTLSHLNARGFIQFHPLLAQCLENYKAAIFLGHALYWSRHLAHTQPQKHGWFFMTARQCQDATSLSTREQVAVRDLLVCRGLLEEALAGKPAKLHYKVNLHAVAKLLDPQKLQQLSWETLTKLFQNSIRFYKPLADVAGSTGSGLYLSYLLSQQYHSFQQQRSPFLEQGEFMVRPEDVRIALGLGIKSQRNAREKLKAAGFMQEGRSHREQVPVRINLAAILACVQAQSGRKLRQNTINKSAAPRSALPPAKPANNPLRLLATALKQNSNALGQPHIDPLKFGASFTPSKLDVRGRQLSFFGSTFSAPSTRLTTTASTPQVARLQGNNSRAVMSMFARVSVSSAHAVKSAPSLPATVQRPTLSTPADQGKNEFALLSNTICPFVETNLPFCRNIKVLQGIKNTTTTARDPYPVDNFEIESSGRRSRVLEIKNTYPNAPETAPETPIQVDQGVDRHRSSQPAPDPAKSISDPIESIGSLASSVVLPTALEAHWHSGILNALSEVTIADRQTLLDELAGQLVLPNKTIHNPVGWFISLAKRFMNGTAVLAFADKVKAEREQRNRALQAYQDAVNRPAAATIPHEHAPLAISAVAQTERDKLRAMRAKWTATGDRS